MRKNLDIQEISLVIFLFYVFCECMWQSSSSWEFAEPDIKRTNLVTDDINLRLNPERDWMPFLALNHAVVMSAH